MFNLDFKSRVLDLRRLNVLIFFKCSFQPIKALFGNLLLHLFKLLKVYWSSLVSFLPNLHFAFNLHFLFLSNNLFLLTKPLEVIFQFLF